MTSDLPGRVRVFAERPILRRFNVELLHEAADEIERLQGELEDINDSHKAVMGERCDDEMHCTCVPALRAEIERLRIERKCYEAVGKESLVLKAERDKARAEIERLKGAILAYKRNRTDQRYDAMIHMGEEVSDDE